jgi:hypothetical protein
MLFGNKKEFLIVFLIAVAAASFSLLPTIDAGLRTPAGYWFTGVSSYFDPWDINTYFAAMRQGFAGSWLYRSPYPPNPPTAIPIHLDYLFLGHLARIFNLSIPFVYHSASFILGIVFLLTVYFFVRSFLRGRFWGLVCLFLIAFGGGFGFLAFGFLPDTAWPDVTVFPTLHLPNFILDQLLFLGVLFFAHRALVKFQRSAGLWAAFWGLVLGFVHPYSLLMADGVVVFLFMALLFRDKNWRRLKFLLPLVLVSVVVGGFFFKIFYLDGWYSGLPISREPLAGYATPSLPILLLGYGLLGFFALVGVFYLWREKGFAAPLLLSWFGGQLLILYLPFSWQRIVIKGLFIVICLLAVWGMRAWRLRENIDNPLRNMVKWWYVHQKPTPGCGGGTGGSV